MKSSPLTMAKLQTDMCWAEGSQIADELTLILFQRAGVW
tara:strand:- start:38 stop:154 length:117 start_codon:yes stop_codon:yes gene_type:complete